MPSTGNAENLATAPAPQRARFRFALRELIVVFLVIAILLGAIIRGFIYVQLVNSKDWRARTMLYCLRAAADSYRAMWHEYPPVPQSGRLDRKYVTQLQTAEVSTQPSTLDLNELKDPWGNPLRIKVEKMKFQIWTCGPNGIDENGQGDDIVFSTEQE